MYHEQGRGASKEKGQLCSLGSGVCPGKLFLPLPLSSLHDVHKTKLLQVTANYYFFFHFLGFQLADSYITRMLSIYRCICRWWGLSKCRKGAYLLKNYIRTISIVHPKLVFYFGINDSKLVCPACKEGLIVPPFLKITLKNKSLIPVPHSRITEMSIIGQWGNK